MAQEVSDWDKEELEKIKKQFEELKEKMRKPGVLWDRKLRKVIKTGTWGKMATKAAHMSEQYPTYKKKARFAPKFLTELEGIDKVLYGKEKV